MQATRGEQQDDEADSEPEHRPSPVEVAERVGRQFDRGTLWGRGIADDADRIAGLHSRQSRRWIDLEARMSALVAPIADLRCHDSAGPGGTRLARLVRHAIDGCPLRALDDQRFRARDRSLRPQLEERDGGAGDEESERREHHVDDRRPAWSEPGSEPERSSLRLRSSCLHECSLIPTADDYANAVRSAAAPLASTNAAAAVSTIAPPGARFA